MQKTVKPSFILALAAWVYVFVVAALRLGQNIGPLTFDNFWVFFLLAIFASGVYTGKRKVVLPNKVRINVNGVIYTDEALIIHELRDGDVFIYVDISKPLGKAPVDSKPHYIGRNK